jgi:diguanylate cyclase (GGDEF)-like protein
MVDPRLVEVEFLAALEKERPVSLIASEWVRRLGVGEPFFGAMVRHLLTEGCLDGPLLSHAGRLRLWRLRDEILRPRIKDSFDLLWDRRHWAADVTVRLAMTPAGSSSSILFIDVDDFKAVNERASYRIGDDVLRAVFATISDGVSGLGEAYRWGGDEVTAFLPGASLETAERVAESIRAAVERKCSLHPRLQDAGLHTTVSVGVGAFREGPSAELVTMAVSELMKRVKARGKNGVVARTIDFMSAAVAENMVG